MSPRTAEAVIERYYAAFNAADWAGMLDCLTDDVVHDINQAGREIGRAAFAAFLARMERCYAERVEDLVVMLSGGGARAAAEFTIHGRYLVADEALPPARGQAYILPVGAFFAIRDGRIARVTNTYNLQDWLSQISG
jgi:steroid delta-isomerase-like uncharacterized protein